MTTRGDKTQVTRANKKVIFAWALYDFANTIFAMNIISRYFPLWVTKEHGAEDIYYSTALSISMFLIAVSIPILGVISDRTGKRIRPVVWLTLGSCFATAGIGLTDSLFTGLLLFIIANYCYQSALVFYDGLLPNVARGTSVARTAGFGVALGYVGAIFGLLVIMPVESHFGSSSVYFATALLFLLFSVPCFLLVKDYGKSHETKNIASHAFHRISGTLKAVRAHRPLFIFMLANFLILDGQNTVIAFMALYADKVAGLSGNKLNLFLVTATLGAALGALFWGFMVNRFGALKIFKVICALWVFTLLFTAGVTSETLFWCVGPLAGIAMGGVWVAGRTLLVELAPPERIGEFFGFYYLAGKASSIIGPMVWGIIVALFTPLGGTIQHRLAVLSLALFIGAGWWLLGKMQTKS